MPNLSILLSGAMLLAGTAAAAAPLHDNGRNEARLARLLKGRVAGEPVNCIDFHQIRSTQVVNRTAIIYRVGERLYVNRPQTGSQSLNNSDVLVTNTPLTQLCSIDVVRLVDPVQHMQTGFVGLGPFVPYEKPGRD